MVVSIVVVLSFYSNVVGVVVVSVAVVVMIATVVLILIVQTEL